MNRTEKRRLRNLAEKAAKNTKPIQSPNPSPEHRTLSIQEAIELALEHQNAGRLPEAGGIYHQILQADPNQPVASHLFGVTAHHAGKSDFAVELITKAVTVKPDYAEAHHSLGNVFKEMGKLDEAASSYRKVLAIEPDYAEAHYNLGVVINELGKPDEAEASYRRALAIEPDFAEAHNNLGGVLKELRKLDGAVASYRKALAIKPDFAEAHYNLGNVFKELEKQDEAASSYRKVLAIAPDYAEAHYSLGNVLKELGKLDEAASSYRKVLAIEPDYAEAHYNLGIVLNELGKLDEAVSSYRKSLAIEPEFAAAHNNLGTVLKELGKLDEAGTSYREALAIRPDYAEAHYNLCETLEKANNTEALREAVNEARGNCPGNPLLALGQAQLLKRDGDHVAARTVLEAAGEGVAGARFLNERAFLLGDLCDRLGDAEAAFNYFEEGNRRSRETPEAKRADGARYLARIEVLEKRFTADWVAGWGHLEGGDDRPAPVFLVGFPRSGTTLLDTILRSHPAIGVVEEIPAIASVQRALERFPGGYPDGLAALDPARLAELRQIYFAELDKHLEPRDRATVVIDKLPLNIARVGEIHRIFPEARFVFAQRHPCDCVLSCFMQSFKINDPMANFLDLEDAARLYDKVMILWQQYRAVLPLDVHTVRYESLIEAFEETLSPLLDFLGLDWDDAVKNYAETARRRGNIDTPSYNQVTQPLYTRARGRWERYRAQMQPVLPVLLPWAKRLGYDA